MMTERPQSFSKDAMMLGYAGLLPQIAALVMIALESEWRWVAAACAFAYAALIFSFLGGAWWGGAVQREEVRRWPYWVAVCPSLVALALYFPWTVGWEWPAPQLVLLGILLGLSPLVDRALGYGPKNWFKLRRNLSIGLGGLTFIIGLLV